MANTLTPTTDAEGNVTGYDLQQNNEGAWKNNNDYVEFNDGSIHHRFENVEVDEDLPQDLSAEYYDALASTYPELGDALQWAGQYLPRETITEYHQALENEDFLKVNETLEYIINNYRAAGDVPLVEEVENEEAPEDWTEEDQDELDSTVTQLYEAEPQGEEYADSWQAVVEQAQEAGDDTYAAIAAATAAFHSGEVSAEEAVNYVLSNFDIRDVERVYRQMTQ